jgi:nitrite reductase/ring-hydroxylating ferredoxin subunit
MTYLCNINEIEENTSKGFRVDKNNYFAVKKDGEVYLYHNQCPHLGVELNWMEDQFLDMDNSLIQCFTHGALFLIEDGQCISGPCLGEQLQPASFSIVDGQVMLTS